MVKSNNRATRNLIPERFREAREARGFTTEEFAEAISVTRQTIAQYETGQISPAPEVISKIIGLTGQPPSFFTTDRFRSAEHFRSPFWRSLRRMDRPNRLRISRRLEWAHDICRYVEEFIELPKVNLPAIDFEVERPTEHDIEMAAELVRAHWGLGKGPLTSFTRVLEANGVVLICEPVRCDDMDAVSRWQGGRPYILYAEENQSGPRSMFNLAHELGHIFLHSTIDLDYKNLDLVERQANRFAGALLLPRSSFASEVVSTSIKYFEYLKQRWGVSIAAMIYRCKDLNLLSKSQHGYLMRQMNALGMLQREPLDDSFQPLKPLVLSEALRMLVEHGVRTKLQIESTLCLNADDVASLCGCPAVLQNKVVPFPIRRHT